MVYLTASGKDVAEQLVAVWGRNELELIAAGPSLSSQVRSLWEEYESLIFIMAVGIVVRLIGPLLESKWEDPGVVVVDEGAKFSVSLVGGHWGGSNDLARTVADLLGAIPVITTATDVQGKPALDSLAKGWGMLPFPREKVKEANSAFLTGRKVVFYTEWELGVADLDGVEELPLGKGPACPECFPVYVSSHEQDEKRGVSLYPPSLSAGIGCKRGVSAEEILKALEEALKCSGRSRYSLVSLASHEIKADEFGLKEAAKSWGLPLTFYSSEILGRVHEQSPGLADSDFVRERTGVGGVCETAALAAVEEGRLILFKMKLGPVTVALAEAGLLWSESGQAIRKI